MNEIKSELKCSYCKLILKDPVQLPCGDSICENHLMYWHVLKQNRIECQVCKQEFEVKCADLKSIKSIQKPKVYLKFSNKEEEIKILQQKIEESIKVFYEMHDEFISNKNGLDLKCHNHFHEIRFQLDIHRERLKEKIDDIYMEMIEKTKEFESSYLKSLNEKLDYSFEIKTFDEALNEVKEAFRDPSPLIESIREMHLIQENAIQTIQLKLDEMSLVDEDLMAFNEFKPNVSFSKDSFGQLNLGEYSCDRFKSLILTRKQAIQLIKLCQFDSKDKFKLLYRGTKDGFGSDQFHSKCDNTVNTLTILKANGFIFGGFTTEKWDNSRQYQHDVKAFLFSLTNKDNQPCKMNNTSYGSNAIYCDSNYGPTFGYGDLAIGSYSNLKINSYSKLGSCYKHPVYAFESKEADSFLAGAYEFQLSEIEVYQKE